MSAVLGFLASLLFFIAVVEDLFFGAGFEETATSLLVAGVSALLAIWMRLGERL